ncbi:MAG: Wzt carbohydrate-binding domain-containing protein [Marinosulfonomonas sp.]
MARSNVKLLGHDGEQVSQITSGAPLTIQARASASKKLPSSHFSVTITNAAGEACFGVNTSNDQTFVPDLLRGCVATIGQHKWPKFQITVV